TLVVAILPPQPLARVRRSSSPQLSLYLTLVSPRTAGVCQRLMQINANAVAQCMLVVGTLRCAMPNGQTYVCPMHLEVRQPNSGKCSQCGMDLQWVRASQSCDTLLVTPCTSLSWPR